LVVLSACLNSSNDDDSSGPITESGLYTLTSSGLEREYYVRLPTNYVPGEEARPLLIALHGAGDSIDGWFAGGFQGDGLLQLSADEAIMIIPNARPAAEGRRIWDPGTETDYDFFLDLLSELDQRLTYDERRIFVTGHSAGALMTQEYGCRFGNIIRAIAPSAGSITSSAAPRCTGSVAVLQMQSEFDDIVPVTVVTKTRDLWVLYNGFDLDVTAPGIADSCIDYSPGTSAYPVQWCLHDSTNFDGHDWWAKADQTAWDFFTGLPIVEPTVDPPPGGGNSQVVDAFPTTLTLTIDFPETLGEIRMAGLFLYPQGTTRPVSGAPLFMLNAFADLGPATPGSQATLTIPVNLPPDTVLPATYTLVLAVYVVGGSIPIPTPGIDHSQIYEITLEDSTTPVVITDVIVLEAS
jgi:predicted esterase